MNSPMAGADHGQTENQLAQQIRNAGSCRERAELLETKLEALLDRLRGSQPKTVPETINKDVSDHGMMTQLVSQHERTSTAIEGALVLLSEIEQYV